MLLQNKFLNLGNTVVFLEPSGGSGGEEGQRTQYYIVSNTGFSPDPDPIWKNQDPDPWKNVLILE